MRGGTVWCAVLLLGVGLGGCQASPAGRPLTVAAASDLLDAFRQLSPLFEAQTGITVNFTFGSTGLLTQQIEHGAPIDLLAAANVSYVEALEQKGLVDPAGVRLYALGRLTLWARADSPWRLEKIEDLAQAGIERVALANPEHAPYGVAARQALQRAGLWEALQGKLILAENVRQALQYAQSGDVDAALVALSLSVGSGGRWVLVPAELHRPLLQALAVVRASPRQRQARAFADFVTSPRGQSLLAKHGFLPPGSGAGFP